MVAITTLVALVAACLPFSLAAPQTLKPEEAIEEFTRRFGSKEVDYTVEDLHEFEERAGTFAITGVNDGRTGTRLEIRTLFKNRDAFNIFLLALQDFKNQNQNGMLSYYQIAGIHGVPNVPWDGVGGGQGGIGYCTHSSTLFPVWHRVYMGLFEQIFMQSVNKIVNSFSGSTRTKYANAVAGMRFPYWDWAAGIPAGYSSVVPGMLYDLHANVVTPSGKQTIINPLLRYEFHPLDSSGFLYNPWNFWPQTFRYPTSNSQNQVTNTHSQNNLMISAIDNSRNNLRDSVYQLFTLCTDYTEFSNNAAQSSTAGCHTSLESIHDGIHTMVGGTNQGHMTYLWYAAFDPVFFLHHMNVERIFSIWQAVNQGKYFTGGWTLQAATYNLPKGAVVGEDTALAPFHSNTNGASWTARNVVNHRTFHSTFPEFNGWDGKSSSMRNIVNRLYGSSSSGSAKRELPIGQNNPVAPLMKLLDPTGRRYEYITNIATSRFGLNGSYTVYIFLDQPITSDPTQYAFDTNLVGSYGVFAMPNMVGAMGNDLVTGSVPLTTTLVNKVATGALSSMDIADVTPYLQEYLIWKVVTSSGQLINPGATPGLNVSVVSSEVTPAANNDDFPTWAPFDTLADITKGKSGGLSSIISGAVDGLEDCVETIESLIP